MVDESAAGQRRLEVLAERFGFEAFRPGQERVVEALLAGRSALAHPHRGLALLRPEPPDASGPPTEKKVERRDRLGGLIHEYITANARGDPTTALA